jgi:hypothetical protein
MHCGAVATYSNNTECTSVCGYGPAGLHHIRAPLVDLEVRGVPALQYFGNVVWQDEVFTKLNAGEGGAPEWVMHCDIYSLKSAANIVMAIQRGVAG